MFKRLRKAAVNLTLDIPLLYKQLVDVCLVLSNAKNRLFYFKRCQKLPLWPIRASTGGSSTTSTNIVNSIH